MANVPEGAIIIAVHNNTELQDREISFYPKLKHNGI